MLLRNSNFNKIIMPYYCYLLRSLEKENSTRNYVGFTTNPKRRIRQHNGELKCGGARRTSAHRPWAFVVVISGFPNKIVALQFEWQLQHPVESRILREEVGRLPHTKGWKGKLSIVACMLKTLLWRQLKLSMNFIDRDAFDWFYKCRRNDLDNELVLTVVDNLAICVPKDSTSENPCSRSSDTPMQQFHCQECGVARGVKWCCNTCQQFQHLSCTARRALQMDPSPAFIPANGTCFVCNITLAWVDIVRMVVYSDVCGDAESEISDTSSQQCLG